MTEHFLGNNIRLTATATAVILILLFPNHPAERFIWPCNFNFEIKIGFDLQFKIINNLQM